MKSVLLILSILFLLPSVVEAKLNVVTTVPELAQIAEEIGGEGISVKSLARGDEDPHYLEPKPSYVVAVNRADLLIEVGLEFEGGWLPVLVTQSRNPAIQAGQPGRLSASQGISPLDIPTGAIDRSQGDVHPDGNPHYTLDPRNGLRIAKLIADRLSLLDPAHAAEFAARVADFETRLKAKIAEWEGKSAGLKGKKAIAYHKNFAYLANWLQFQVADYIEPKPGIPPSPAHLLSLIALVKRESIPLLLSASYYDSRAVEDLAAKTGAKALIIPTSVLDDGPAKTYIGLFDEIVSQLNTAIGN